MIKITKHLKINILTVIMFAAGIVLRYPPIFYITYIVMVLHECAHLTAALCIGLTPDYLVFQPFGLNLRLKNKIIYSLADEVILYLSGPLVNALAATAATLLYKYTGAEELRFFYISNIMLFVMNILPAVPLDGGMLLKRIISRHKGNRAATMICRTLTIILCAMLMTLGIYVISHNRYNFSLILFSILLMGNVFTQKEKYDVDFIGELMFYKTKKRSRVNHIIAENGEDSAHIAGKFRPDRYNIVYIVSGEGEILDTITETKLIENLTKKEMRQ